MNNSVISKEKCNGCTACMNICQNNAITMKENEEGFKYPLIDESKCINCELCKKICPTINTVKNDSINKCYVGYAKSEEILMKSSSGGIFSLIANYILSNNGIVIGAGFNEKNQLNHIAIENEEDLDKLRGSKYLQSDLKNIFEYINENIEKRKILFIGTPCQVAGLKSFIKLDNENLICIDLICHGVPSPKLFEKHIKELEEKNGELLNYNFRDKCSGWDSYSNTMVFERKNITELNTKNKYMRLFLSNIALRESCYNCNFKLGNKYSDITLGDFWGIKKYYPDMYNKKGVSAIIINTKNGNNIFECINKEMIFKECEIKEIIYENNSLISSCTKPKNRDKFFKEMADKSINELVNKYTYKMPIYKRIVIKMKRLILRLLKK